MSHFKDKLQVFFLGLLLGLLLGGGFFLFKLDQYVKELSIYKSFSHNKEQYAEHVSEKEEKKNEKNTSRYTPFAHTETIQQASRQSDTSAVRNGSGRTAYGSDSLKTNDSLAMHTDANEEIVLRKDQLLNTHSLEIVNVSPVASMTSQSKDSLAAKMAGVRDDRTTGGRQFCTIEIWTSPLNYKGYKMNRNKIILYGLTDTESLKAYKLDDELYLQNGSLVFHLDNTNEFRPYEKVSSEAILSKLK
jgi:hypothetical protein